MLDHEFAEQFDRLSKTYGTRAFPSERVQLIYNAVIGSDYDWFKQLTSQIIGSMRHAPMLPDFRDAALRERKTRFDQEVSRAADKWQSGEYNGLGKYLASIGCKSLVEAVGQERRVMKSPAVLDHAKRQRDLAAMILSKPPF
jgi:hypothetical protein